jgi:hypothetical protein
MTTCTTTAYTPPGMQAWWRIDKPGGGSASSPSVVTTVTSVYVRHTDQMREPSEADP